MKKLHVNYWQYAKDLVNWVNSQDDIVVISISARGKFEGEGYALFYYKEV